LFTTLFIKPKPDTTFSRSMCGIFYYETIGFGSGKRIPVSKLQTLQTNFAKISHRGPDNSRFVVSRFAVNGQRCMGFHRLAINGLAATGDQPFDIMGCELV